MAIWFKIVGFLVFLISYAFFSMGIRMWRTKTAMQNTPTSKVRSAAMGLVELAGTVKANKTLKAPFSGKECVYYESKIEEYRASAKDGDWHTIASDSNRVDFFINDGTGSMLLMPQGAEISVKPETFEFTSSVQKFYEEHKITYISPGNQLRIQEYAIFPTQEIFVLGTVANDAGMVGLSKKGSLFYISDQPEKMNISKLRVEAVLLILGGLLMMATTATLLAIDFGLFPGQQISYSTQTSLS